MLARTLLTTLAPVLEDTLSTAGGFAWNQESGGNPWTPVARLDNKLFILDMGAGHYTTNTGGVNQWTDQSGQGNNALQGTAANRPDVQTSDGNGLDSLRFLTAAPDQVNFTGKGVTMGAAIVNKFGFSCWVKLDTLVDYGVILDNNYTAAHLQFAILTRDAGTNNFGIYLSNNGTAVAFNGRVAHTDWTNWHHLVVNYDGSLADSTPDNPPTADDRLQAFIDGLPVTISIQSGTVPATLFSGDLDWQVGSESGAIGLNGRLDNMVMVTDTFTTAEIAQLYAWRKHS